MNITADRGIMENTFLIQTATHTGTCYCLTADNKQYLVTARHLFPNDKHGDAVKISLWKDGKWSSTDSRSWFHDNSVIDIAVLPLSGVLAQHYNVKIGTESMVIGSETFFYGYPYQIKFNYRGLNNGFPLPFVKRATISGWFQESSVDPYVILLDGINNQGFSGGPIGHFDTTTKVLSLYGFISGYQSEKKEMVTPIGNFPYEQNTGIIVAYAADHALQIIKKETVKK